MAGAKEVMVTTMVEVVEHTAQQACIDRREVGPTITGWFSHMMVQAGNTAKLPCELGVTYTHYIQITDQFFNQNARSKIQ